MHRTFSRRNSTLAVAVAIIAVLLAGIWLTYHLSTIAHGTASAPAGAAADGASDASGSPAVQTTRARTGELDITISAQGRVGPPAGSDAKLAFAVPGIIASLDVRVGQRVARGDALAQLDRGGLANSVASAQADLASAQAQYAGGNVGSTAAANARAKLAVAEAHLTELERGGQGAQSDRIAAVATERQASLKVDADRQAVDRERALFAGGIAAQKDVAAAITQLANDEADDRAARAKVDAAGLGFAASLRQARADVAQAQADLSAASTQSGTTSAQVQAAAAKLAFAQRDYDNGVLRAPAAGVVLAILKHAGEAVDTTTPALDVGPSESGTVTVSVPTGDAARTRPGDPATLSFSGGTSARGRVVAVVPNVDPATQAGTVVVSGVPSQIPIGSGVSATIVVAHASGTLIPSSAVVQDPQTGDTIVFVRQRSKDAPFAARTVRVGATTAASAVVTAGLKPGDEIATTGAYNLLAPSGG